MNETTYHIATWNKFDNRKYIDEDAELGLRLEKSLEHCIAYLLELDVRIDYKTESGIWISRMGSKTCIEKDEDADNPELQPFLDWDWPKAKPTPVHKPDTSAAQLKRLRTRVQNLQDENAKLEMQIEGTQARLNEAAEVLQVFAQFATIKAHDDEAITISVPVSALREARRLLGGAFHDYSSDKLTDSALIGMQCNPMRRAD